MQVAITVLLRASDTARCFARACRDSILSIMTQTLYGKTWDPLFNDEDTMTSLLHDMGGPHGLSFELSCMIDETVLSQSRLLGAIVTSISREDYNADRDLRESKVQVEWNARSNGPEAMKFVPQTVDNACGIFSIIDLAVNIDHVTFGNPSIVRSFRGLY